MDINAIKALINSLNNLDISKNDKNKKSISEDKDEDYSEDKVNSVDSLKLKKDNDEDKDDLNIQNYKIEDLYDRLLKDEKYIQYKELKVNIKKKV